MYNEIVKIVSVGGWYSYVMEKFGKKGGQKPAEAHEKPAEAHEKPGEAAEKPGEPAEKPVEASEEKHADPDGTCFFHEIGKKTHDLLDKDYNTGLMFIAGFKAFDTAAISADALKQMGKAYLDLELSSSANSKLIKLSVDDVLRPGITGILSVPIPPQNTSKVELRYRHVGACITASSELQGWPDVSISAVTGTKTVAFGADVLLNTRSRQFPKYTCGLSLSEGNIAAALTMENADILTASYHQKLDEKTSIAAKMEHVMSSKDCTYTAGFSHAIDPSTTVKAKLNSDGMASLLLQYSPKPKCYLTFSAESDSLALRKETKFGLCVALGA